jgi:Domain of unknown function (DUF4232)
MVVIAFLFAVLVPGCSSGGGKEAASARRASVLSLPVCDDHSTTIRIQSQGIALGTIVTAWRVTNRAPSRCRSFGYPALDFHTEEGWLHVDVARDHLQSANVAPSRVVLKRGDSLYFVSEWSDADTASGRCKEFDRVTVTLPNDVTPAKLHTSGCINAEPVRIGPVSATIPSSLRSAHS